MSFVNFTLEIWSLNEISLINMSKKEEKNLNNNKTKEIWLLLFF